MYQSTHSKTDAYGFYLLKVAIYKIYPLEISTGKRYKSQEARIKTKRRLVSSILNLIV